MKYLVFFGITMGFLAGCTSSSLSSYTDINLPQNIASQTIFITKWDNSFSIEEAECPEEWSPFLLTTKSKKNGSTTYIVQCVQRA